MQTQSTTAPATTVATPRLQLRSQIAANVAWHDNVDLCRDLRAWMQSEKLTPAVAAMRLTARGATATALERILDGAHPGTGKAWAALIAPTATSSAVDFAKLSALIVCEMGQAQRKRPSRTRATADAIRVAAKSFAKDRVNGQRPNSLGIDGLGGVIRSLVAHELGDKASPHDREKSAMRWWSRVNSYASFFKPTSTHVERPAATTPAQIHGRPTLLRNGNLKCTVLRTVEIEVSPTDALWASGMEIVNSGKTI